MDDTKGAVRTTAFVVESEARDAEGLLRGTFRVWVATEQRAKQLAEEVPGRTWRVVTLEEMPKQAREGLLNTGSYLIAERK